MVFCDITNGQINFVTFHVDVDMTWHFFDFSDVLWVRKRFWRHMKVKDQELEESEKDITMQEMQRAIE